MNYIANILIKDTSREQREQFSANHWATIWRKGQINGKTHNFMDIKRNERF